MQTAIRECQQPICILAHDLVNNLSVIVGRCDLMLDPGQLDEQRAKYLSQIRDTAKLMADKLNNHQCQLAALARSVAPDRVGKVIT
jgi:hypothetical protein